jgi:predicted RNA binding protein YcfA (HicA-like mRNA interferase family)
MKIPRNLSGTHLADALCRRWGYARVHQVGSHIILETEVPAHQRIAIPDHHPLRLGTLASILRAVARHNGVTRDAILETL